MSVKGGAALEGVGRRVWGRGGGDHFVPRLARTQSNRSRVSVSGEGML